MTQNGIQHDMQCLNISKPSSDENETLERNESQSQALDMLQRARLLLDELSRFQQHLKDLKVEDALYLTAFKSDVHLELQLLEKASSYFSSSCKTI